MARSMPVPKTITERDYFLSYRTGASSDKSSKVLFSKPLPKQIAPTLVRGQRRGTCGCSIIVPGPCAGGGSIWRHGGTSAHCGERKNGGRSISCDDGSDCASGVSCGRLCGGLYLGDDWPCVLLGALESFACTTLPRRSWIFIEETIIYNRLLARSQALSGLERAVSSAAVKGNSRTVARSIPPRPLPPTLHALRSLGSAVDAVRRAGYPWTEQMSRKMLRNVEKRGVQAARNSRARTGSLDIALSGRGQPLSGAREAWLAPNVPLPSTSPWPRFSHYSPLTALLSPHAPRRRPKIGFVFLIDPAFVRPKSQCVND